MLEWGVELDGKRRMFLSTRELHQRFALILNRSLVWIYILDVFALTRRVCKFPFVISDDAAFLKVTERHVLLKKKKEKKRIYERPRWHPYSLSRDQAEISLQFRHVTLSGWLLQSLLTTKPRISHCKKDKPNIINKQISELNKNIIELDARMGSRAWWKEADVPFHPRTSPKICLDTESLISLNIYSGRLCPDETRM